MGYWQLLAFAAACLGVLTGFSYALRPIFNNMARTGSSDQDGGASISAGELEEMIGRAVEAGNAPLHARLDALEEELRGAGQRLEGTQTKQLSQGSST